MNHKLKCAPETLMQSNGHRSVRRQAPNVISLSTRELIYRHIRGLFAAVRAFDCRASNGHQRTNNGIHKELEFINTIIINVPSYSGVYSLCVKPSQYPDPVKLISGNKCCEVLGLS